ncbi:enolase-binding protein-like [Wyeomyia smithii]|uniref:enolase-binding protein-like n=1 Tax=Wyeomyia smithii TaxID=174621 RepID=UPI002467E84A|nr:enolase-binding protein-like [Wyeomyia smithii]
MKLDSRPTTTAIILLVLTLRTGFSLGQQSVFTGSQQEVNIKSFLSDICDNNSSLMNAMVKSLGTEYIDRNLHHLCTEGTNGLLIWIPAENSVNIPDLNSKLPYIGRAAASEDFSGYCTYHPSNGTCSNEHGDLSTPLMILGEKYPERYELRDTTYKKWTNSTLLGSPVLAYATLKNREISYKYVDQDISYLADTRIEHRLPATVIPGLPLAIYRGKVQAYQAITGETYYNRVFKTINAIRYMSPYTLVNVTVIGTEERDYREFRAKLVIVYSDEEGLNWSRVLTSIEGATIETSLTNTRVQYGLVVNSKDESQLPSGAVPSSEAPHTDHQYPGRPVMAKSENIHIHINEVELGKVYPGFRPFAIGAAIILFSVLGIALIDITRRVCRNRRAKRLNLGKYKYVNAS